MRLKHHGMSGINWYYVILDGNIEVAGHPANQNEESLISYILSNKGVEWSAASLENGDGILRRIQGG